MQGALRKKCCKQQQANLVGRLEVECLHVAIGKIDPVFDGEPGAKMDIEFDAAWVRFPIIGESIRRSDDLRERSA